MANELPGMTGKGVERVSIPEVDRLVENYVKARDVAADYVKQEHTADDELRCALRANEDKIPPDRDGTIVYRHDDLVVTLKRGKEKLKVEKKAAAASRKRRSKKRQPSSQWNNND